MAIATKAGKTKTKPVKIAKGNRRLVELVVRLDDEKGQAFTALVLALSAKGFEVTRGSRGARADGKVIYSVVVSTDKK
jgi:hypothetical protein